MARPSEDNPFVFVPEPEVIEGTRLEQVEDLRAAFGEPVRVSPTLHEPRAKDDTLAFRPVRRPPMAILCILDDGRLDGEWVRLRGDTTIIGRSEGDVLIPHDTMMSTRHAEISRVADKNGSRWYLTDLGSRNGTYVRITSTLLVHEQEILLGSRRYRFDAAPQGLAESPAPAAAPGTTGWDRPAMTSLLPSLVELTAKGDGQRWFLIDGDNVLGRDAQQCSIVLADDPLVSPRHARLFRDPKNRWALENTGSHNGVWVRIKRLPITSAGHFLLGEQRFIFRIL